jgi:excisionase family DNA binding protein
VKLLSVKETAEALGVSRQTAMRMIAEGLPAICLRSGRRKKVWRVREAALEGWLLQHEKQAARAHVGGRNGKVETLKGENANGANEIFKQ